MENQRNTPLVLSRAPLISWSTSARVRCARRSLAIVVVELVDGGIDGSAAKHPIVNTTQLMAPASSVRAAPRTAQGDRSAEPIFR